MLFENKYVGTSNGAEENGYHLKPSNVVETKFSFVNYKVKENDNHVQLLTKVSVLLHCAFWARSTTGQKIVKYKRILGLF